MPESRRTAGDAANDAADRDSVERNSDGVRSEPGFALPIPTVADGLHLDLKGYQVWADALKPIFKKLLGAPAKEDKAPPPTGDPSAQNTK